MIAMPAAFTDKASIVSCLFFFCGLHRSLLNYVYISTENETSRTSDKLVSDEAIQEMKQGRPRLAQ